MKDSVLWTVFTQAPLVTEVISGRIIQQNHYPSFAHSDWEGIFSCGFSCWNSEHHQW